MPTNWLTSVPGRNLLEQEQIAARNVLDRVFGDQIVQLGSWGPPDLLLESARTQYSALLGCAGDEGISACVESSRLAIQTDSVDAVLLPHTLEISEDPHGVLREVHRILRPDGKLIVFGFNPLSWWGLRNRFSMNGYPPGIKRHISRLRLEDWLRLLNLGVDRVYPCFVSARSRPKAWLRLNWFASSYVLLATKDVIPMTIIRPRLRRRPRLLESFANPTTRNVA